MDKCDVNGNTAEKWPEISVIVPVYGVEKYLPECIDSILAQTFTNFELILVDDGSPDHCPALCDAAAEKDSRVRVIHKTNGGVGTARNAGLDTVKGNWIAFVDSDDRVLPQFLEKLYSAAREKNTDIAMCGTYGTSPAGDYFKNKNGDGYDTDEAVYDEVLQQQEVLNRCIFSAYQVMWNKIYRKHIFDRWRFPAGMAFEDTWLLPHIYTESDSIACIAEPLYCYRILPGSAMNRKITMKTLDRVEACYEMFRVMEQYKADTLCSAYRTIVTSLADIWLHLTPQERRTPRMKECIGYKREAWKKLKQAHGITPRSLWDMLRYTINARKYLAARRKRLAEQK